MALSFSPGTAGETRPVILCEYCHSMGNSTGNIHKYWEAFEAHPHLQVGGDLRCAVAEAKPLLPARSLLPDVQHASFHDGMGAIRSRSWREQSWRLHLGLGGL